VLGCRVGCGCVQQEGAATGSLDKRLGDCRWAGVGRRGGVLGLQGLDP
jgi:hypothetical protein